MCEQNLLTKLDTRIRGTGVVWRMEARGTRVGGGGAFIRSY